MKLDKAKHAPGTILLVEMAGAVQEVIIVGWAPKRRLELTRGRTC